MRSPWGLGKSRYRVTHAERGAHYVLPKKALLAAPLLAGVFATSALAVSPQVTREYQQAYHAVAHADGTRAPGRNIVLNGLSTGGVPSDARVLTSLAVLDRMLAPPPVVHQVVYQTHPVYQTHQTYAPPVWHAPAPQAASPPVVHQAYVPAPQPVYHAAPESVYHAPQASSSTGASGVPACASESGSNYSTSASNTNSSSGATGRYQIIPSTAAAYGCNLGSPAGQDACAQTIYQHQGAGAWVGCGG